MPYVIALDCGITVTKAVVFDQNAQPHGEFGVRSPHAAERPHWVERDGQELWDAAVAATAGALADAGIPAEQIAGVAVTGHGDGLYLVDACGRPTRPGISSLDSRAQGIVDRWQESGKTEQIIALSGQQPFAASPAAVLRWLVENEPDVVARSRWALSCKDYINMRLTGIASTDFSEASESFTGNDTQDYDDALLDLYGLSDLGHLRPAINDPAAIIGTITSDAASLTGLVAGTPVVAGLHDVDASALGSGAIRPGQLVIVAGSYSINEIFTDTPIIDRRWLSRNAPVRGRWLNMAISPTSTTCLEWFLHSGAINLHDEARRTDRDVYALVADAYASVRDDEEIPVFLPYLYGAPEESRSEGAFLGLQGWHNQAHLVRAVLEGIVFNHRLHVDALRDGLEPREVRLTGGAARAPYWAQLFADALGLPVLGIETRQTGALGAALCALTGIGAHPDLEAAVDSLEPESVLYRPRPTHTETLDRQYRRFRSYADALGAAER